MKFLKYKFLLAGILISFCSTMVPTNLFIVNKVKEGSIFVEVDYYAIWPLVSKRKVTLKYNQGLTLLGTNLIRYIRVRNTKNEVETKTVGVVGSQQQIQSSVVSRIVSLSDAKINKACAEFKKLNPKKNKSVCQSRYFDMMGGRLKNKEVVIKEDVRDVILPLAFAITRASNGIDFNVVSLPTDALSPADFYYFVKGKDLDSY
ncbi:hypothetical protein KAH94_01535 [bacterium]|nr:hypothetical protein [bacterium]